MNNLENAPRIYVGTYGQYNDGSLFGKWFDLSDYENLKDFLQDCFEFHRNEFDPELMFQDWENIPDFLIFECSLHENAFAYFEAIGEMDEKIPPKHLRSIATTLTAGPSTDMSWKINLNVSGRITAATLEVP